MRRLARLLGRQTHEGNSICCSTVPGVMRITDLLRRGVQGVRTGTGSDDLAIKRMPMSPAILRGAEKRWQRFRARPQELPVSDPGPLPGLPGEIHRRPAGGQRQGQAESARTTRADHRCRLAPPPCQAAHPPLGRLRQAPLRRGGAPDPVSGTLSVNRIAIANQRIQSIEEGQVTFTYLDTREKEAVSAESIKTVQGWNL